MQTKSSEAIFFFPRAGSLFPRLQSHELSAPAEEPAHGLRCTGTAPAPRPACQPGLPSAGAPSWPSRFYEVPDERDSINVAWKATTPQMKGDKELRQ